MEKKQLATTIIVRRIVLLSIMLWGAVASSSLFTPDSALLHAQRVEKGIASYYTKKWTGRKTASGERLHHDSLTCAHKTMPFGTLLKVYCPSTDRTVVVRVTDRGPYVRGRIIDLSWGAADRLGILTKGIAKVEVERYVPDPNNPLQADSTTVGGFNGTPRYTNNSPLIEVTDEVPFPVTD